MTRVKGEKREVEEERDRGVGERERDNVRW
jgi:hypothetical protein